MYCIDCDKYYMSVSKKDIVRSFLLYKWYCGRGHEIPLRRKTENGDIVTINPHDYSVDEAWDEAV